MDTRWRIQLLGGLRAARGDREITRFRTQKTGALLAYLAYHLDREHPREILIELFWPEAEINRGRQSLSQELYDLRRQLEPPGTPAGVVLLKDRAMVRLNPAAVTTDVAEFEAALGAAARVSADGGLPALRGAVDLYQGELLPGFYEDWVQQERQRLAERHFQAVCLLIAHLEAAGDLAAAIDRDFGSLGELKKKLKDTAVNHFASGWAWLVSRDGTLSVTDTHDAGTELVAGIKPLLVIDVWEHAYYLKYQNKRADYLKAFWNVVNWAEVAKNY